MQTKKDTNFKFQQHVQQCLQNGQSLQQLDKTEITLYTKTDNPHLIKHIKQIESVQRRFTKWLPGMTNRTYRERLAVTGLESLELRRLIYDLVCTYKILSNKLLPPDTLVPGSPGLMDLNVDDLF